MYLIYTLTFKQTKELVCDNRGLQCSKRNSTVYR